MVLMRAASAAITLTGIERMHMIRKGQLKDADKHVRRRYGFTNLSVIRSLSPIAKYLSLSLSFRRSVGGKVQTPSG